MDKLSVLYHYNPRRKWESTTPRERSEQIRVLGTKNCIQDTTSVKYKLTIRIEIRCSQIDRPLQLHVRSVTYLKVTKEVPSGKKIKKQKNITLSEQIPYSIEKSRKTAKSIPVIHIRVYNRSLSWLGTCASIEKRVVGLSYFYRSKYDERRK